MTSRLLTKITSSSSNAKIFRAGATVSALGLVTTVATAVKELTIARYFGRNDAIDAFFIAYLLPSFSVTLVVGSLGAALIPVYVDVRRKGGSGPAQELFSSVMFLTVLALTAIAVLLGLFSSYYLPFLGSGFSPEKLIMTRELLVALLPFVLFSGIALCVTSVLNAGEQFALPALTPLATPLIVILFVIFTARLWNAYAIVIGTVFGSVVEASALARTLNKQGIRFRVKWNGLTEDVRAVLRQYSPMIAGSFLMGSTLVVDKSMAAMLPGGSVAALTYANKIVSAVFAIGASALGTAAFPYFSGMIADKDWGGCRHTLKRYTVLLLAITVPFTVCLIAFSKPLVRLLFQHGAFTPADTVLVSKVQTCYLIQLPFYILAILFVRFLSAAKRNDVLMYGAGIGLILDVVLNLVFMRYWGVAGIALSTSAVYACTLAYVAVYSMRVLRESQDVAYAVHVRTNPS